MLKKIINKLMLLTFVFAGLSSLQLNAMIESSKIKTSLTEINIDTELFNACESGNLNLVENLSKDPNNLIVQDEDGLTPFLTACFYGHKNIVEYLLDKYPYLINQKNDTKSKPLHFACLSGKSDLVKYLLSIITSNDLTIGDIAGVTPFLYACSNGHKNIVEYLLKTYPSLKLLNQKNNLQSTPLHLACSSGNLDLVKYLLKNSKDLTLTNKDGATPLHLACFYGQKNIVEYLLKTYPELIDQKDRTKAKLLDHACASGNLDLVKYLLKNSKDLTLTNINGVTPFLFACFKGQKNIVEYLLDTYPELNLLKQKSNNNSTAEEITKKHGNFNIEILPSYNKKLKDNEFLLHCIKHERFRDAINHIKNKCDKDDLTFKDENGQTPLILACEANQENLIKSILDKLKEIKITSATIINKKDNYGYTPIIWACMHKNWDLAETLLEYCSPETIETFAEISDYTKCSCLELACELNAPVNIIKKLTTPKTINIKNKQNKTPLYYAYKNNNLEIVNFLLSIGANLEPELLNEESFKSNANPVINFFLQSVIELDRHIDKIDLLKTIKSTGNKDLTKLLTTRTIYKYLTTLPENQNQEIHETDLAKMFINKELNIKEILEIKTKDIFSFIEKINKKLKLNIDLYTSFYSKLNKNFECSYCLNEKQLLKNNEYNSEEFVTTPCNHTFCKGCLNLWLKENNTCPLCRETIK